MNVTDEKGNHLVNYFLSSTGRSMRLLDPSAGGMVHSPKRLNQKAWVLRSREQRKVRWEGEG